MEARALARAVVQSSLVKAAFHGRDPNWGRIAGAAGNALVAEPAMSALANHPFVKMNYQEDYDDLSTLAHELNQPLGALSSFATGLLNRLNAGRISPGETAPVVQRIAGLAERAGRIIQRVNAIARRREISLQRLDLIPVLQRMAPHAVPDAAPVWVNADELLIEHLLNNLLTNAQEAAHAHSATPQVHLGLRLEQDWAQISISDNGPGVPEENQAHIFDAFFSSKATRHGFGFGLTDRDQFINT